MAVRVHWEWCENVRAAFWQESKPGSPVLAIGQPGCVRRNSDCGVVSFNPQPIGEAEVQRILAYRLRVIEARILNVD